HIAHAEQRLLDLDQVAERLEDEEVDAALSESRRLLTEDLPRLIDRRRAVRLDADAERTDRAAHEHATPRDLRRDLRRARVDFVDLRLQTVLRELHPVRAEAVRLDQLRTRLHVRAMDLPDEIRLLDVQLVVATVDEDTLAVQHGAHRAVEDVRSVVVEEIFEVHPLVTGGSGERNFSPQSTLWTLSRFTRCVRVRGF